MDKRAGSPFEKNKVSASLYRTYLQFRWAMGMWCFSCGRAVAVLLLKNENNNNKKADYVSWWLRKSKKSMRNNLLPCWGSLGLERVKKNMREAQLEILSTYTKKVWESIHSAVQIVHTCEPDCMRWTKFTSCWFNSPLEGLSWETWKWKQYKKVYMCTHTTCNSWKLGMNTE